MTKDEFDQLIDSLRHRPVATTAAQMRHAADELERLQYRHCTDCCCARSWRALGLENLPYTGKSIPEHITELIQALESIEGMRGMTLLGGSDLEPNRAHELGAHKAFNQAAEIARSALQRDSHP